MRARRMRLWLMLPLAILLLAAAGLAWLTRPVGPRKPASIALGDDSYARDLAGYLVRRAMARYHVPGAALVMIDDQRIVWQASFGFADRERRIPVDDDTVFKLWSLAKPVTALQVVQLADQGRLDLDTPLTRYLPDLSIRSRFAATEAITLRHLLTHRSGLPRSPCRYDFGWEIGPDALAALSVALEDCFLTYPAGHRYKYSNVGYVTLGLLVQELGGRPFPPLLRDELLRPIGMTRSAFWTTELPPGSQLALGYGYHDGGYHPYEQGDYPRISSGNLYATAGDLAALVQFVFRGGEADGVQLIRSESLAAMFEDRYSGPADPQATGLGWKLGRVAGSELLAWHDGGPSEGIGSLIAMLPERKLAVVLLGNATSLEGSVLLPIAIEVLEAMLEARRGWAPTERSVPAAVFVPAAVLDGYVGDYVVLGDVLKVTRAGRRLRGRIQGMAFDLVPVAPDRFRVGHWLLRLGLDRFLPLPMDLRELTFSFRHGEEPRDTSLIVDFGGAFVEVGPRYPALPEDGPHLALVGRYEVRALTPAGRPAGERLGERSIALEDGRLVMSGAIGPILPLDDATLFILGGPFHGETILWDRASGDLIHQGVVLRPLALGAEGNAGASDR